MTTRQKQITKTFQPLTAISILTISLTILFTANFAQADCDFDSVPQSNDEALLLLSFNRLNCLGVTSEDTSELTQEMDKLAYRAAPEEQINGVNKALKYLIQYTKDRTNTAANKSEWSNLTVELEQTALKLSALSPTPSLDEYRKNADQIFTNKWNYIEVMMADEDIYIPLNGEKVYPFKPLASCTSSGCSEYNDRLDMLRVFAWMRKLQSFATIFNQSQPQ